MAIRSTKLTATLQNTKVVDRVVSKRRNSHHRFLQRGLMKTTLADTQRYIRSYYIYDVCLDDSIVISRLIPSDFYNWRLDETNFNIQWRTGS